VTLGFSYDELKYPTNYRNPPLLDTETTTSRFSPKLGLLWKPWTNGVLRAAYTSSLGGVSLDDSVRLEPTLVGGFNQALRTLVPESVEGSVNAGRDDRINVGLEQKLGSGTYLAAEAYSYTSRVNRSIGIFRGEGELLGDAFLLTEQILPATTEEKLRYEDRGLVFTANQLLGGGWSLGLLYSLDAVDLESTLPRIAAATAPQFRASILEQAFEDRQATLHQGRLSAVYNDPSGFFARAEALWYRQENRGYAPTDRKAGFISPAEGADFWMYNVYGGYRLPRNLGDVSVGLLNLTSTDYRLNPLNEYSELPRKFTVSVQTRLNF
jgi:outer membrane receptor protein involved in Fe transport